MDQQPTLGEMLAKAQDVLDRAMPPSTTPRYRRLVDAARTYIRRAMTELNGPVKRQDYGLATCLRCSLSWRRAHPEPPARCPRCKSTQWRTPSTRQRYECRCSTCGTKWMSGKQKPSTCPKCGAGQ